MRVSNHWGFSGGLSRPPVLGDYDVLAHRLQTFKIWNGFLLGLFFLSGVYHLILFLYGRSKREYLLFALLSFATVFLVSLLELPSLFHAGQHFFDIQVRWIWSLILIVGILIYWFLVKQFEYNNRWLNWLIVGGSTLLLLPLVLPFELSLINALQPLRERWYRLTLLVGIYVIFWAVRKQKPGSRILIIGVVPLALGGIYSTLIFESFWGLAGFAFLVIAMAVSLSSKMSGIEKEVRRTRDVFSLFVPQPVLDKIAKKGLESIKLGGAEEGIATILFTDMRSFTAIAEKLSPTETLAFLNEFMTLMQPVINKNGGFINQFVGDEIMAIFYMPGQGDAAIETAIAMRKTLNAHNHERVKRGQPPIEIGVGINTGKVIWGTIGSEVRMESAVIGDTVNLASRLQSLTKHYGVGVLVSESAYQKISNPKKYCCRKVDVAPIKGKTQPVVIYELFDADPEPLRNQKMQSLAPYNQALELFYANDWQQAESLFKACLQICLDDPIPRLYIERCRAQLMKFDNQTR